MKIYSSAISPFAARVRAALYYKSLPFEDLGLPAEGLKSAAYLAINPMGRIPVMVLNDGTVIPESETIMEYLEDAFPQRPLMPAEATDRARVRTLTRVTDNYVTPPTTRLFAHLDPAQRDAQIVADELQRMRTGLAYLEHFIGAGPYAYGSQLTLADCCVFPSLYLCEIIAGQLGVESVLAPAAKLARYFEDARADAHLGRIHEEIATALREYQH